MRPLSTVYAPWWRPATTPEYAATLSRVLSNAGHSQEAEGWRISAAARYDALVLRHPEAFIGHVRRDGRHRGRASLRQPFLRGHSGPIMTV
jgi:hypothetical protein